MLVHGAFAGAWCWEPVLEPLRAAGHTVEAVDLPGSGTDDTPATEVDLDAYARKICAVLAAGPPAVLAGQSMGGMAITQAAARCPEHVTGLVYISGFVPQDGQSLTDLVSYPEAADDQVQANLVVDGDVAILRGERAKLAMLDCGTPEQAAWAEERLTPQPIGAFTQKVSARGERFTALPRAYILCSRDRAIPPQMQRRMIDDGNFDPVIEIETDHWPWLSRTEEFLAAMEEIVARPSFSAGPPG